MTQENRRALVYNVLMGPIVVNNDRGDRAISDWPPVVRVIADRMGKASPHVTDFHLRGRLVAKIERDIVAWWTQELPSAEK